MRGELSAGSPVYVEKSVAIATHTRSRRAKPKGLGYNRSVGYPKDREGITVRNRTARHFRGIEKLHRPTHSISGLPSMRKRFTLKHRNTFKIRLTRSKG